MTILSNAYPSPSGRRFFYQTNRSSKQLNAGYFKRPGITHASLDCGGKGAAVDTALVFPHGSARRSWMGAFGRVEETKAAWRCVR